MKDEITIEWIEPNYFDAGVIGEKERILCNSKVYYTARVNDLNIQGDYITRETSKEKMIEEIMGFLKRDYDTNNIVKEEPRKENRNAWISVPGTVLPNLDDKVEVCSEDMLWQAEAVYTGTAFYISKVIKDKAGFGRPTITHWRPIYNG